MRPNARAIVTLFFLSAALAGCSAPVASTQSESSAQPATHATPGPLPTGPVGKLASYGRDILNDTPKYMKSYVRADMSCSACHLQSGTQARGGSLVGIYARFPQYNKRAHRVIALQDRIAECFLYSMNGHPPAYQSKEMTAMVAYFAYLSAGTPVGAKQDPSIAYDKFSPPSPPDKGHGAQLYSQKCSMCHQASGAGVSGQFPPVWGAKSFNAGAGMHRLGTMASFVRHNMPLGAPNTLSAQEAYDVSAFILSHPRPAFAKDASIVFPPEKASYF